LAHETEEDKISDSNSSPARLDFYHHLQFVSLRGNLYTAPLKPDLHNILDCGTGTGIWALDMREMFPSAQVVGVDLSPIQPEW
jgi:methylase of polypeptide subunit release factors